MNTVRTKAFARAALVGNPSDGYYGRTISVTVKNFWAEVQLQESAMLEVLPARQDQCRFDTLADFLSDQRLNGYYGGLRLIKAAIKRFAQWCDQEDFSLPAKNFTLRYSSNIPRQVGLAGSSAIVTATLRALFEFYGAAIRKELMPSLSLAVETEELGINAGLQDRVAQVYEGLTYMDFDRALLDANGHGHYESLDPLLAGPLYLAYRNELAECSEIPHNEIRRRFREGDPAVVDGMRLLAALTLEARSCLLAGDRQALAHLINKNFDVRRSMYQLHLQHIRMAEAARHCGASANFTGSGGAIIGTYDGDDMLARLRSTLADEGCTVIEPVVE